jgi:hypothetical protein
MTLPVNVDNFDYSTSKDKVTHIYKIPKQTFKQKNPDKNQKKISTKNYK